MSIPKKHHYLPEFFIRRWTGDDGKITEFRRPHDQLVCKQKWPSQTGFIIDLYANEAKADPVERQALELLFMQKVDDAAASALLYIERGKGKPSDPLLRDAWSRFLMSLLHRSPERVKYLTAKVKEYEEDSLNPELAQKYAEMRSEDDPPTYEEWLEKAGLLTPDLRVRLLKLLIDSRRIGNTLNAMHWHLYVLERPRFGFLTGDHPIMVSNGLGHNRSFVLLAISPSKLFVAAHDPKVIDAFLTQRANGLEHAVNDACARQSKHIILAHDSAQLTFVDRRFLKASVPVGRSGFVTWNSPLVDLR